MTADTATMTGEQYERALFAVGLNTHSARLFFGIKSSTSYRYRAGLSPVPRPIALTLAAMVAGKLTAPEVEAHLTKMKRRKA